MSADATRKLVQDFYVAFKSGKMTDVLAFLTPDFLLAQQNYGLPTSGTWRGHEAFIKFSDIHRANFELTKYDPTIQMVTEDKAFVTIAWEGKCRLTGKSCPASVAHFFQIHNGHISRLDVWIDSYSVNKLLQA